jgi:hypothetical protein
MQKVVGSSPISRFGSACKSATFATEHTARYGRASDPEWTLGANRSATPPEPRQETRLATAISH